MKRIFTILSFCLPLFAVGQSFELDPSEDIYQEHFVNDYSGDDILVKNISNDPITVNFETLSNTFLGDWKGTVCAGPDCFNHIPDTGTAGVILPGGEGFYQCSMFFGEFAGEGTLTIRFYDANDETIADTISLTYKVEEITNTHNLANDYNFKLSPNPTMGTLNVVNDHIELYEVNVYSMTGQLILNEKVSGKSWNGDLFNQNSGIYILTVTDKTGLIYRQKISKT
ncbi:MAG: T9SS type A sorting domain-containing protein [Bacteroidetes bacterium]|jgi:hypothetical protein|nr:T9SS type A sorting domain-containing protein [Bacteroidota bacterium]MDF1863318.1 T9SS type A sorting domain-containing protein [Saprospiraceae bacterium]